MLLDSVRECYNKQKISISFDDIEKALNDLYTEKYSSRFNSIEDFANVASPEEILQHGIDHYVEKYAQSTQTPEWETIKTTLKENTHLQKSKYVCVAPHNTLRFDFGGEITVCCNNLTYNLGIYPETTPEQAWSGDKIKHLRKKLTQYDFTLGCQNCARHILAGNVRNSILGQYYRSMPDVDPNYPTRLVFQLQNTCNYACIMCSEEYSSTISKLRGGTTPCKSPYNDNFIEQITPFLCKAKKAEFIGGEPFLIPIYYKMWGVIKNVNPNLVIDIISNGSVFNDKVKKTLCDLPGAYVHVSLDSLNPETYAYVRRNGSLPELLTNIEQFHKINKLGSISMSPIIQTVYELPNMVEYCNQLGVELRISNVVDLISGPGGMYKGLYKTGNACNKTKDKFYEAPIDEFRLRTLPQKEKLKIKYFLLSKTYPPKYREVVHSFINFLTNY